MSQFVYGNSHGLVLCLETQTKSFRDILDRPIILSVGVVFGTLDEMKDQVNYALTRSKQYQVGNGICTVIEGNHKSFRFPDKTIVELLRYICKTHPECLNSPIHFVNLSRLYQFGVSIALKVIPEKLARNVYIHKNADSLHRHLQAESRLKRWGGKEDFDIDKYAEWRCLSERATKCHNQRQIGKDSLTAAKCELHKHFG